MTKDDLRELERREGGATNAGAAVGVSPQVWNGWKARNFPADAQLRVFLALHPRGRGLLRSWLKERGQHGNGG